MIRLLPFAIDLFLLVFCLIDCIVADEPRVRNLPRWGWIVLIVIIPVVGGLAWLLAGRPLRSASPRRASRTTVAPTQEQPHQHPMAPDDDPAFLAKLKRENSDHERMLKRWEEDLRRREEDLRRQDDESGTPEQGPDDRDLR